MLENDNSIEQWFDIGGWEGFYQISNLCNVKSIKRKGFKRNGVPYKVNERILKHQYDKKLNLYYVVLFHQERKEKFYIENLNLRITQGSKVDFKYPNLKYAILQYNGDRKLLRKWNSYKEIQENTSYNINQIYKCCQDKYKKHCDCYWEKIELPY